MRETHPPMPGPVVQPNFLAVMEAVGDVTFPIAKRELIEQVGDGTVILAGRNVELHELIKDIHDDFFESESEFLAALERHYARTEGAESEGGMLPTGRRGSWQSSAGPGNAGSPNSILEPQE